MELVLFLIAAVLLLLITSGGYVFYTACLRRKELPWLDEEELKKTSYGKYCEYISAGYKWLQTHKTEEVSVQSEDALTLRGIWVPAKEPKGTVLLAHGYRSCIFADFSMVFAFYHKLGWNMLLPYQRAHGKSDGKYITFGVKESRDMLCWVDFHNATFGKLPLILSGLSMGASTVMYLADEPLPKNVKGIIADCGFTSPKAILTKVFKEVTHLPAAPTLLVTELFARFIAGFGLTQKDTRKSLAANRLPIILVHGTGDHFVPCDMTKQSFEACTGPKQLFLVEGAAHGVSFLKDPQGYQNLVQDFMKKILEEK